MKVSICIPTYNQGLFIEQTIRSCTNQTLPPYEIIVSNDCSTDETSNILECLQKQITNLKIINQPFNLGIVKNTNCSLRFASGDFIVRLDSDDALLPNYTNTLSKVLSKFPKAGYAHGAVEEIDHHGNTLKIRKLFRNTGFYDSEKALQQASKGYRVAANIIMFRRTALHEVGFITTSINFAEDYHLAASLAAKGFGNVYVNEVLSKYRVWEDVAKIRPKRKLAEIIGVRLVFEEVLEPAYIARWWDLGKLKRSRSDFASQHANSLSWDIYSKNEKNEIEEEILKLSSSSTVKLSVWLYTNGYGQILNLISLIKGLPKLFIKKIALSLMR